MFPIQRVHTDGKIFDVSQIRNPDWLLKEKCATFIQPLRASKKINTASCIENIAVGCRTHSSLSAFTKDSKHGAEQIAYTQLFSDGYKLFPFVCRGSQPLWLPKLMVSFADF